MRYVLLVPDKVIGDFWRNVLNGCFQGAGLFKV